MEITKYTIKLSTTNEYSNDPSATDYATKMHSTRHLLLYKEAFDISLFPLCIKT